MSGDVKRIEDVKKVPEAGGERVEKPGRFGASRREFLGMATAAGVTGLMALTPKARAQEEEEAFPGPAAKVALVGVGMHGREMLRYLTTMAGAQVVAVCEPYEAYRKRAEGLAPEAAAYADAATMLAESPEIEAVFVATPTHTHREIVEAALGAGKHVYCEAPIAATLDEGRAIARAAQASDKVFASGLQLRSNPHYNHALKFLQVRAIGELVYDEAHWHENTSWRRASSDAAFTKELNWRLDPEISLGLPGEAGVHFFDTTLRSMDAYPTAVTAFGSIAKWNDGREVADTVMCHFDFPSGFQSQFEATLANSFGGKSHTLNAGQGAILLRENRAWMFKEADAPSLGWEVYAMREPVGQDEGIVLVANATKLLDMDRIPGEHAEQELRDAQDSVYIAMQDFLRAARTGGEPAAGAKEGYEALVMAVAANRSIEEKGRVEIVAQDFEIS